MQSRKLQWIGLGAWSAIVAAAMVACGGGGGSSPATAQDGSMRFALTDAPSCGFDHVWVTVSKISVNTSATAQDSDAGWTDLTLSPARRIDLLSLTNGVLEELGTMPLASGHYSQVRLVLASNSGAATPENAVQPTGGAVTALTTPSGQQSGVKLQANADVAPGQLADLVLDFDACSSIVKAGNSGQYLLKPVVKVVPRTVSAITGAVAASAASGTTVSVQQSGAVIRSTSPDATGNFSIPYLTPGTYDVVITSDGHATAVITSVPAGSTATAVSSTPISPPVSPMATVTGAVTAASAPVTDATVRATQALTGGPTIQVARTQVDATAATYSLKLPTAAAVKAAYVASGTITFAPDTATAGKYTIETTAPNRSALTKPADVSSSSSVQVNFGY